MAIVSSDRIPLTIYNKKDSSAKMKKILIGILLLQGISAIFGGVELVRTNGMGMPISWLANSPFNSFLIPGLILMIIVGGTSLSACYLLINNNKYQYESSAIAGFGIQIWIFVQIYLIQQGSLLQAIYFSSGIIILILTIRLLKTKN